MRSRRRSFSDCLQKLLKAVLRHLLPLQFGLYLLTRALQFAQGNNFVVHLGHDLFDDLDVGRKRATRKP